MEAERRPNVPETPSHAAVRRRPQSPHQGAFEIARHDQNFRPAVGEKRRAGEALIREGITVSGHHVWYFAVRAMLSGGDEVLRVLKVDIANSNGVRGILTFENNLMFTRICRNFGLKTCNKISVI